MRGGLTLERWAPTIGGVLIAAAYLVGCRTYRAPSTAKDLLTAVVSISGISVGFLATAKAILVTLDKRQIVQDLRDAGYYTNVIDYLLLAIFWSFSLALASAAGIIIDVHDNAMLYPIGVATWLFLVTGSVLAYYRVIRIFGKILRYDDHDN